MKLIDKKQKKSIGKGVKFIIGAAASGIVGYLGIKAFQKYVERQERDGVI